MQMQILEETTSNIQTLLKKTILIENRILDLEEKLNITNNNFRDTTSKDNITNDSFVEQYYYNIS